MGSTDPDPDSDPDETRDESTGSESESDSPAEQPAGQGSMLPLSRRAALAYLAGIGGLSLTSSPAVAIQAKEWKKDRDAQGYKLFNLGELEMIDDPVIASTDGTPLELRLNGERVLRLAPTPARSAANVLCGHPSNTLGSGVEGATISGGGFAESGGASRPNEVLGDFGTVSGGRGNAVHSSHATIGGGRGHVASGKFATVAGGLNNDASDEKAAIGGGENNVASGLVATVAGGGVNRAKGRDATVAGGINNLASSHDDPTVAGGGGNLAIDRWATVGGGLGNEASGKSATVPGGRDNTAGGTYSFAAGRAAKAKHNGAFVVGNSTFTDVESSGADEVRFQAGGGFMIEDLNSGNEAPLTYDTSTGEVLVDNSSARYKTNIEPLEPEPGAVLDLEPRSFEYTETGANGVGLSAEEVDEHVPELVVRDSEGRPDGVRYDRLGVYLVPEVRTNRDRVTEVERSVEEREGRIDELKVELDEKTDRIDDLEAESERKDERIDVQRERIDELDRENEQLRERLATVEDRLAGLETGRSPASADD